MAVTAARKARLKAAKARDRRMALVRRADPTEVYLLDANWKEAVSHYIETGRIPSLGAIPYPIREAIPEAEMEGAP